MAFDSLSDKLQNVFKKLRSKGVLTEDDLAEIQTAIEVQYPTENETTPNESEAK